MSDDAVNAGSVDDLEAAVQRVFADAWRDATQSKVDEPVGWMVDAATVEVTSGDIDELDDDMVAVRSASALVERQVRVRGGRFDVVLDVARSDDHVDVRGTVFGTDEPCSVQLLDGVDESALAVTDEFGEFALLGVAPQPYELVVSAGRAELSVELDLT